jgi:aspartyl-tRNA(Asn)/glutamyl-tRNA(Gln) amidotransferase subunit B
MSYETVIGLETHIQLGTASKAFCADAAAFGGAPNTHTGIISLAHPGTLPRLNKKAIEYAVKLGMALGCEINRRTSFDRKNYFYADLPKGFQTTQDRAPVCLGGGISLKVEKAGGQKSTPRIRIHHIHLEEDAGKSMHDQAPDHSFIDLNRAGVPLLEIVSEPDLRGPEEVAAYMEEMRRLVRWLGISDGNMEEGSMRCDVNISIRPAGSTAFGNRCEIKNMNSMRFAKRAIEYEVNRQIALVEAGGTVVQETRGFDVASGATYSLREKENAHDYRYFPEPDLPPVVLSEQFLSGIQAQMPALPAELEAMFRESFGLPAYDAEQLTQDYDTARYARQLMDLALVHYPGKNLNKNIANLLINKLLPWSVSENKALESCPVRPEFWLEYTDMIESGQLSASAAAQRLFPALLEQPATAPALLAAQLNLLQSADTGFLEQLVDEVLARFPDKVAEYRKGKKGLLAMFMGEVMKNSKGKAEPQATTRMLRDKLEA